MKLDLPQLLDQRVLVLGLGDSGLAMARWCARFGAQVGGWLRLDDEVAAAGGFVTALVVVILVVAIAGRVVRKVFHFAGLGVADTLLGIAVSVLKYLLVLSVLFSAFDALNEDYCLVGPRTIEQSKSYKPVRWLSESIFPFLEWVGERVPRQEEKTETDG
jgi:membrane protein required for colicin V production